MSAITREIRAAVQVNSELHDAYVESLRARMAGSVREDRPYYQERIDRAGNYDYDADELAELLMFRAGFQSYGGGEFADFLVDSE